MLVIRSMEEIPAGLPAIAATIGNFDGVHRGHREIFKRVRNAAADIHGASMVVTFEPHPLKVVPSRKKINLITTAAEKEALIGAAGIDYLLVIPFTPEFSQRSPREFVSGFLVERVGLKRLVIGYDYAFGRNREGGIDLLAELGREFGFTLEVLPPIGVGEHPFSSSEIRRLVWDGAVHRVVPLLGRHFSLGGTVVHGHGRGKGMGFPTANVATDHELIPSDGVYAVKVRVGAGFHDGACNIGTKPTFGGEGRTIEVYLFDFDGNLYDQHLRIFFMERLRGEERYPDPSALQRAIDGDVARCRQILGNTPLHEELLEGDAP
jgi:riboflavin kinase / FMN adenylyltransferase